MTIDDHDHTVMKRILTDEANAPWCAAVGECGLDASEGFPPIDDQIPWFRKQVELAEELQLPLFVHERLAFEQTMDVLKTTTVPVIIHCFTGTQDQCRQYIDRGYFVSVSGFILKENADNCDEVRKCLSEGILPLERLMIETDSPYMGFTNCRQWYVEHNQELISSALNSKKRKRLVQSMYPNVPTSLLGVLDKVVECLQQHDQSITKDQVAAATTANAKSFFGFKFGE
uniref:TatD related DNase n=1 Tax=Craspedostauros australis TaxID=1486917 RepID=A0A7R9WT86_9STRA|mmetsp:Transcript_19618/g.54539  ORF Transcript_19618/g.54539 Transcript_19618/m.54539 type:complete len:229 (+) Transcript_19618:2-688(+)